MSSEIQKADPVLRRRLLLVAAAITLALVLGVLRLESYLGELQVLARTSPYEAAQLTLGAARLLLLVIAAGAVATGAVLGRLSLRTLRSGRYPPPGAAVIRDTPVLTGRRAQRYGWSGLAVSVLIVAVGLLVTYRIDRVLLAALAERFEPTVETPKQLGVR